MLKKVVDYVDFNDENQTDTLYFNLTEAEVVRLDVQFKGGLIRFIENLDEEVNPEDILSLFEKVIRAAYGEKSEDGKHFLKNDEMMAMFHQSAAYSALFVGLLQDTENATAFFNGLLSQTTRTPAPAS